MLLCILGHVANFAGKLYNHFVIAFEFPFKTNFVSKFNAARKTSVSVKNGCSVGKLIDQGLNIRN